MGIKAMVFDCGGVLLRNGDLSPYRRWEERLGLAEGDLERHLWMGDLWRLAERYGVADRFEVIVNSARVGLAKPDAAIYEELLRRLRLNAGEVVFIDDRAENVAAAASLRMHVAWFLGAAELERQLEVYLDPGAARAPDADQG